MIIVDSFKISSAKTKEFSTILNGLNLSNVKTTILLNEINDNVVLGSRNLKNIYLLKASNASACDLLDCEVLVLDRDAAEYYNNFFKK